MNATNTQHTISFLARAALGALAFAILLAIGLAGCGSNHERAEAPEAGDASTTGGQMVVASLPAPETPAPTTWTGRAVALGDSLPPEVAVSVEDTLVRAGDVIEITARGSDDVSQMGLSDAIGRVQLFTQESATGVWRVLYRVPLGGTKDRIGLSVTAVNDVNRWRRVWVFLRIRSAESPESTPSDSSVHE